MHTHVSAPETPSDAIKEQIFNSLEKAQAHMHTFKRKNARYVTANSVLAFLAALLAGLAGTIGNAQDWKIICLVAAVCSAGATVTTKLQKADELTEASECVGQLKALSIETSAPTYDREHVRTKYQQILSEYSTIDD